MLAEQIVPDLMLSWNQQTSTSVELRRLGLETLHRVSILDVDFRFFGAIQLARNGTTDSISGQPYLCHSHETDSTCNWLGNPWRTTAVW